MRADQFERVSLFTQIQASFSPYLNSSAFLSLLKFERVSFFTQIRASFILYLNLGEFFKRRLSILPDKAITDYISKLTTFNKNFTLSLHKFKWVSLFSQIRVFFILYDLVFFSPRNACRPIRSSFSLYSDSSEFLPLLKFERVFRKSAEYIFL